MLPRVGEEPSTTGGAVTTSSKNVSGARDCERTTGREPIVLEPFLQFRDHEIYNPITEARIDSGSHLGRKVLACAAQGITPTGLSGDDLSNLQSEGWIVEDDGRLDRRFVLRYVSLESHSVCNQACYFCPVSSHPRDSLFMPDDLYSTIVAQLAGYSESIKAVFMMSYNEPTIDSRLVEHIRLLWKSGLTPAMNSNGTGLTPEKILEIRRAGGVGYLEINLSTLDPKKYNFDRGGDHLNLVLRNLDHLASHPISPRMEISVLGHRDREHDHTVKEVARRFSGSPFRIRGGELMDRAGNVDTGRRPGSPVNNLGGCDNTGSRVVEHLHITPSGECIVCCQDYFGRHLVGDLRSESLTGILTGDAFARVRRWTYGMEQAPEDYLCRRCVFAIEALSKEREWIPGDRGECR